jgi:hypothetical protein
MSVPRCGVSLADLHRLSLRLLKAQDNRRSPAPEAPPNRDLTARFIARVYEARSDRIENQSFGVMSGKRGMTH